ncbi:hypothetical protein PMAYCL1PPCAC_04084, partial [Pristionchus mayeri]
QKLNFNVTSLNDTESLSIDDNDRSNGIFMTKVRSVDGDRFGKTSRYVARNKKIIAMLNPIRIVVKEQCGSRVHIGK